MFERQKVLKEIGQIGHEMIAKSSACVVGSGALGCWTSFLLGSMGVGRVVLVDRDIVDETNLFHQPIYSKDDLGGPKAFIAKEKLTELYQNTKWESLDIDLNSETIKQIKADVILDCTDNFETRFLINEFCIVNKIPWVYSTALRTFGLVHGFIPGNACLKCVYTNPHPDETCEISGIYNPSAASVSSLQVSEAMKILTGKKPDERLIRIDIFKPELDLVHFKKDPKCSACGLRKFEFLNKKPQQLITFCGGEVYQGYTKTKGKEARIGPLIIFKDGRVLVKAKSEQEAKAKISKYIP